MKTIILLLISLFIFIINLNTKQTTFKKQNDTIITVANSIDCISVINILDVKMTLNNDSYLYLQDTYNNYKVLNSSVITSNHSFNSLECITNYIPVINNKSNKVLQTYRAKTIGLQYDNSKYFNIYLYHSNNKLGFT